MKAVKFTPASVDGGVKDSVLLEFPDFKLSLIFTEKGLFAEVLSDGSRRTFKAEVVEEEIESAVRKVMERLKDIVEVYQKG